jgi:hypothetical protein
MQLQNQEGPHEAPEDPETAEQALVMVDRARAALDAAIDFQTVRHCRTAAVAAAALAHEAQDRTLLDRAQRLKLYAERRGGEMLIEALADGTRAVPGLVPSRRKDPVASDNTIPLTLQQIGIARPDATHWQRLARIPRADFEAALGTLPLGHVSRAAVLREAPPPVRVAPPRKTPPPPVKNDRPKKPTAADRRKALFDATPPASAFAGKAFAFVVAIETWRRSGETLSDVEREGLEKVAAAVAALLSPPTEEE